VKGLSKASGVLGVALVVASLTLSACSPGSLGTSTGGETTAPGATSAASSAAAPAEKVTITFLVDNGAQTGPMAEALAAGFNAANPGITVKVDNSRPGGTDGDNYVKTQLATGSMPDVFNYNSGALLGQIDPGKNLVDLSNEPWVAKLADSFKAGVTVNGKVYGVPFGQSQAGGILYNKKVFSDLGLKVPTTWDEFMANNAKIKAAGIAPVIQTYGGSDTWSSQLLILADFHNVAAADPQWATKYTNNQAKFVDQPALKGFQRIQAIHDAGYMNKDYASAQVTKGTQMLVDGTGAQYPMLTFLVPAYVALSKDAASNIGFFGQPGDDAASNGMTDWLPAGVYVPNTTTGAKLDAVKKFLNYIVTPDACKALDTAGIPATGPYMVKGCTLPADVPAAVQDVQKYLDAGKDTPALEFLSPVKGPNLEKICVQVGSGIIKADAAGKAYDQDVKAQAQQLGLPGW